jgi:hypothetical protein
VLAWVHPDRFADAGWIDALLVDSDAHVGNAIGVDDDRPDARRQFDDSLAGRDGACGRSTVACSPGTLRDGFERSYRRGDLPMLLTATGHLERGGDRQCRGILAGEPRALVDASRWRSHGLARPWSGVRRPCDHE